MINKVELVVEGVDLEEPDVLDIVAEHFAVLAWAESGGVMTATVLTGADPQAEVVSFAKNLPRKILGARVVRVHDDLVG